MKYRNNKPGRRDLDAGKHLSRAEYRDWVRVVELGEAVALHLHGMLKYRDASKVERALKEIIESGHDLQEDGSVFDCNFCWESARHYRRTGHINMLTPAPRTGETVDELDYLKCHLQ